MNRDVNPRIGKARQTATSGEKLNICIDIIYKKKKIKKMKKIRCIFNRKTYRLN